MGRIKLPRCDNCGAPVEFAQGVTEARCEYCNELLIRELPAAPAPQAAWAPPAAPPPRPPAVARRGTIVPLLFAGVSMLVVAGASTFANVASHMMPLPEPAPVARQTLAVATPLRVERTPLTPRATEAQSGAATDRSRASEAPTSRSRLRPRPTATPTTASAVPAAPPPPPKFDGRAAAAGLDAAKAKAEASCRGTTGVRLFVQMGFDADGVNRGAALSDPKLGGTREAKCTLRIFRAVRIPPFDLKTRSSGLGRMVRL